MISKTRQGIIALLILYDTILIRSACIYCCHCGELLPINPYLIIGQTIQLNCSLNETTENISSADLYFTYNHSIHLPKEYIRILDDKTIAFIKPNVTLQDAGSYSCMINGRSHQDAVVETQILEVEYPLQNVTNFSCIVEDWDVKLACQWDIGKYQNAANIDVKLYGSNSPWQSFNCPEQNQTHGLWLKEDATINMIEWTFKIHIANRKTDQKREQEFKIIIDSVVKPYRPSWVQYRFVNSTDASIEWEVRRPNRDQIFKVTYKSSKNTNSTEILSGRCIDGDCQNDIHMTGLMPFTTYDVEIRSRPLSPKKNQTGFWSEPRKLTFQTSEYDPSEPPELISYESNLLSCYNGYKMRNVTLYWKNINEEKVNGILTGYCIEAIGDERNKTCVKVRPGQVLRHMTIPIWCQYSYNITLSVANKEGDSPKSEPLQIPAFMDFTPPENVVVEYSLYDVSVHWSTHNQESGQEYKVVWCHEMCENTDIGWKKVKGNMLNMSLSGSADFHFGVAINVGQYHSGFAWNTCSYIKNAAPYRPVIENVIQDDTSIQVTWKDESCNNHVGYPYFYQVHWCEMIDNMCQGNWKQKTISSEQESTFLIQNLKLNSKYGIKMLAVNRDGLESGFTEQRDMILNNPYLKPSNIAWIAVVAVVVSFFMISGMLFCVNWCIQNKRSIESTKEIVIPEIKSYPKLNNISSVCKEDIPPLSPVSSEPLLKLENLPTKLSHQESKDSGKDSLPSDVASSLGNQPVPKLNLAEYKSDNCSSDHSSSHHHYNPYIQQGITSSASTEIESYNLCGSFDSSCQQESPVVNDSSRQITSGIDSYSRFCIDNLHIEPVTPPRSVSPLKDGLYGPNVKTGQASPVIQPQTLICGQAMIKPSFVPDPDTSAQNLHTSQSNDSSNMENETHDEIASGSRNINCVECSSSSVNSCIEDSSTYLHKCWQNYSSCDVAYQQMGYNTDSSADTSSYLSS